MLSNITKVIPIYKSGSQSSICNFRPISLLIALAKILEKSVNIQLTNYLNDHQLIDEQYGFRAGQNTTDALFDFTKFISREVGEKKHGLITFLNLAKTFESVDRV